MTKYSEDYYKTLNYTDYLHRKDRYINIAKEISNMLECIGLLNKQSSIMDYGCATGFLSESLINMGFSNVHGYDISEWACSVARSKGIDLYSSVYESHFDVMFFLDVLEHMLADEIINVLNTFTAKTVVARIPVSTNGGQSFHLEVSNKDKTHVTCKEKDWWINTFRNAGYLVFLPLDLYTIWDSDGVFSFLALR